MHSIQTILGRVSTLDLSIVLSVTAIIVSVITLWLTEFRGPSISLLDRNPRFELEEGRYLGKKIPDYTPNYLDLKKLSLVFANYGGAAGTILGVRLEFKPQPLLKDFIEQFYQSVETGLPLTIKRGENQHLTVSLGLSIGNWKKMMLAEMLEPKLKLDDIIQKASEESKEKFRSFCDLLTGSPELGKVSCYATLTRGRFRPKVTESKLFENLPVINHYDKVASYFSDCLKEWKNLHPTDEELAFETKFYLEELLRELKRNWQVLSDPVSEQNIAQSKLRQDRWISYRQESIPYEKKIRWFLIESEKQLEEKLARFYEEITKYNGLIDNFMSLGEFRTDEHIQELNIEREKLHSSLGKIMESLSKVHERHIR
jgi:hypothetical protein